MISNILNINFLCSCLHQYQDVMYEDWSPPPCPFGAVQKLVAFRGHPETVFRKVVCECGNEVGLQIHSSDAKIGYWKLSPHLV